MASPLSGAMAKAIYSGMKGLFLDATLTRTTNSTPANEWEEPATTGTDYTCKALIEEYSDFQIANGLVDANDRKVLVLANSLSVTPQPTTDSITVRGYSYGVVSPVKTDPALAVWELRVRNGELAPTLSFDYSNPGNSQYLPLLII